MTQAHSFHIPVMGTGFTIDTPIKVAKYGIDSVISLVDDTLIEQVRKFYCEKTGRSYQPITKADEDCRARRITAYLNLVDVIVKEQFDTLKNLPFEDESEIHTYFELQADHSPLKQLYQFMRDEKDPEKRKVLEENLRSQMKPGSIDVNIMTKLDRTNYAGSTELPAEFSDAMAALRGFAKSKLNAAIVFSAGFNRRLYSYAEKFEDFFANAKGFIQKRIIVKVSDYRSSLIQGRFFAQKGLWVSEFRMESGLNCGGHTFASPGILMGPILNEFKKRKQELIDSLHKAYSQALEKLNRPVFSSPLPMKVTAQGGICSCAEDQFLKREYGIDGTGWGTPFLCVPDVVNVDPDTLKKLLDAKEKDLFLSPVSPVGVPFNNLRSSSSELGKQKRIADGVPGSKCPKGHLRFSTEFTEKPLCVSSRAYQKKKIEELDAQGLPPEEYKAAYDAIVCKSCICHELGGAVMINFGIPNADAGDVLSAICPGPSMAYFSKAVSLKEMVDHVYGRINLITEKCRPHMFIKEFSMYLDHLKNEFEAVVSDPTKKQIQYLEEFCRNLIDGIAYYKDLFPRIVEESQASREKILQDLDVLREKLEACISSHTQRLQIAFV